MSHSSEPLHTRLATLSEAVDRVLRNAGTLAPWDLETERRAIQRSFVLAVVDARKIERTLDEIVSEALENEKTLNALADSIRGTPGNVVAIPFGGRCT